MKLKKIHLPIVVAEASDLPLGTLGEFITADTLKPYLDQIATKSTPAQISTAVNALKAELVGTAGISVDTFGEMKTFVDSVQSLQQSDKDSILSILATCVKTADIMPIVNAKASEQSVATRLAEKVATADIMPTLNAKATKVELQTETTTRTSEVSRVEGLVIAEKSSRDHDVSNLSTDIQREVSARQQDVVNLGIDIAKKATKVELQTEVTARTTEVARVEAIANSKSTPAYVGTEINIARADVRGYVDNHILNLNQNVFPLLASKIEATSISTALTNALRTEILAWEGVDDTRMASLQALLAQLTALEASDVTGIMATLSQKVAKDHVLDGNTIGLLADFLLVTNQQVGDGKVIDAIRIRNFFAETFAKIDTGLADKISEGRLLFNSFFPNALEDDYYNTLMSFDETTLVPKKIFSAVVVRRLLKSLKATHIDNKANTADAFAKASVLNSTWSTANLASWIAFKDATDAQIGSGKVLDAQILRNILREVVAHSDTKIANFRQLR